MTTAPASPPLRALVLCPGRGSYSRETLGALQHLDAPSLAPLDTVRRAAGQPTVRELDAAPRFTPRLHLAGEHASILTAGASLADLDQLDPAKVQVVAVCGNSMGWYTALGYAGALDLGDCARLIETLAWYQADNVIGGQIVYPLVGDDWQPDPARVRAVADAVARIPDLHWSIRLGGQAVLGGSTEALAAAQEALPPIDGGAYTFPLRLPMHSAFHTPLLAETARRAQQAIADLPFQAPRVPLVDGQGTVWRPRHADPRALAAYTLGPQVETPYDFARMVTVALREYAPDVVILPGPGGSLGGAVGQVLVAEGWAGLRSRADFAARQATAQALLVSMARPEQRARVTAG